MRRESSLVIIIIIIEIIIIIMQRSSKRGATAQRAEVRRRCMALSMAEPLRAAPPGGYAVAEPGALFSAEAAGGASQAVRGLVRARVVHIPEAKGAGPIRHTHKKQRAQGTTTTTTTMTTTMTTG